MTFARVRAQRQRLREEAAGKLSLAIENGHQSNLQMWLERGKELEMNQKWYVGLYPVFGLANEALEGIRNASRELTQYEGKRDQESLEKTLEIAESKLNMTEEMYPAITKAKRTLERMLGCREGLRTACEKVWMPGGHTLMDQVIQACVDFQYGHAPEMDEAKRLLSLRVEDENQQAQLLSLTKGKGFAKDSGEKTLTAETEMLTQAIGAASNFQMKTAEGKRALLRAILVLNLRQTLENAYGTKDVALWAEVVNRARAAVILSGDLACHPDVIWAIEEANSARFRI